MGSKTSRAQWSQNWKQAGLGFMIGALIGLAATELGLTDLVHLNWDVFLLPGLLCTGIALTRARIVLYIAAAILLLTLLIVGYTPLPNHLIAGLVRKDALYSSPAIVVLSANVHKNHTLGDRAQARVLHGYALLRQGYSNHLVITHSVLPFEEEAPIVRRQMKILGFDYTLEDTGPVTDTHDEAIAVAALAHRHGWDHVILVTHPWHMRRAAAVFETAGVRVLCSPCNEGGYDMDWLDTPPGRYEAFRDWLHEVVGYQVYRWRGWIR